ncbi:sugar kinase [Streptomonospora nanhaiensis]|uniref:sugar kinase n=1 Tax=Streptomonospora nanhaiensis TaxID=1323731 RepID=UPI001C392167|nr:sugar kinase [Streptomonospora nanhaiensis]MBV2363679.1 sugar kinase [Streptomonospora nanhaiensis]MBX9387731.1 sugar kinase [Streptomonospora nanhaiensis]
MDHQRHTDLWPGEQDPPAPAGGAGLDAVCVGETMALLVPDPAGTDGRRSFQLEIGGAESNVAIHLARTGLRVAWYSALGDDDLGRHVRGRVAAEGVDCRVRTDPDRPTGLYLKEFDGTGRTRVRYYRRGSAASALGAADAARVRAEAPRLVHTTGITPALSEGCRALVDALFTEAAPGTLRSFDVNYRPALHGPDEARVLRETARRADVVFCGLDEAESLWGAATLDDVRELLEGPDLLVVKQGAEGATAFRGGRSWFAPAPEVEVVEPVGAGDAFAAGVLHGLLTGADVAASLAEGARLAGTALGVRGDIPPRPS